MYCDGAFAPEDLRAPEYLEGEGWVQQVQNHKNNRREAHFLS